MGAPLGPSLGRVEVFGHQLACGEVAEHIGDVVRVAQARSGGDLKTPMVQRPLSCLGNHGAQRTCSWPLRFHKDWRGCTLPVAVHGDLVIFARQVAMMGHAREACLQMRGYLSFHFIPRCATRKVVQVHDGFVGTRVSCLR